MLFVQAFIKALLAVAIFGIKIEFTYKSTNPQDKLSCRWGPGGLTTFTYFRLPFFKEEGKFCLPSPEGGGIWKIKKRGWKYGVGAGLLKRGGGLVFFLFNFFKVYHFYI